MNIFIFGDGAYVTGRKTHEYGVIFPAICEYVNQGKIVDKIFLFSNSKSGQIAARKQINKIISKTKVTFKIEYILGFKEIRKIIHNKYIKKPVCAFVCTPDHTHYKYIKEALKYNLHTFSVKPFVLKTLHALELVKIQKKNNLISYVDFHKRYDNQNILTRDNYLNNKIGNLLNINVSYSQKKINPEVNFKKWAKETNILQYLGVHYIDLVYFITKAVPVRVMAVGQSNYLKSKLKYDIYDSIQCIIEWKEKNKNVFSQTICVNWIDPNSSSAMSDQKYIMTGTLGNILCEQKSRGLTLTSDQEGINEINPDFCVNFSKNNKLRFNGYGIESVQTFLIDVLNFNDKKISLKEIELSRPTFSQSLISTKIVEAAKISLKSKSTWIRIF